MGRCSDARDRLLDSAAHLFHDRGYSAVSVSDICADADLKKGSFYHFFPSKRDLMLATIDRYAEHQKRRMDETAAVPGTARERVLGMFAASASGLMMCREANGTLRGCPVGNLALEMAHRDDEIREKLSGIFAGWRQGVERILRGAVERDEMNIANPAAVAESLIALLEGAILLAKATNDPGVVGRLSTSVEAILEGSSSAPTN